MLGRSTRNSQSLMEIVESAFRLPMQATGEQGRIRSLKGQRAIVLGARKD